jgi:hypothetical protein
VEPLLIEGSIPKEGTSRWFAWRVLEDTLRKNNLKFNFAENEPSFQEMVNKRYDIRIRGSSIGSGVEGWGLFVSFCSSMGINFPDPNSRVCKMLKDYEEDKITEDQLTTNFLTSVVEEAAILPVSHYGVKLFLSENINTDSFSPLMAIIKFDQIELK